MARPTMSSENLSEKPTRQRYLLIAILTFSLMVAFLDRVNVSVLIADDQFLSDMGIAGQPVKMGLLMSTFLAAYGVSNVVLSPVSAFLGPRKTVIISFALMAVSVFIGGIAGGFTMMIASRILLGITEGVYYPLQNAFVKNWFPLQERGRANATWNLGQSIAPAISVPIFTFIIGEFGWRPSFFFLVLLGLIPLYLFTFHTADTPREHKRVNNLEVQHIESGSTEESADNTGVQEPVLEEAKHFAKNYGFWLLVFWYASMNLMNWGLTTWMPNYLRTELGFSWGQMGWLASLPFILGIILKVVSGWVNDRIMRSAPILMASMVLGSLGIFSGVLAVDIDKYLAAVLLAFGQGFVLMGIPSAWTLLQSLVTAKAVTIASGTMNGISTGIAALSPTLFGLFISITGSFSSALYFMIGIGIAAAVSAGILTFVKRL